MPAEFEIWHNPRCSKSRATLELIEQTGAEVVVRRYLEDAPSAGEIEAALKRLGIEPWELARMKEPLARELGLADLQREGNREAWIELLAGNPKLIERPIVLSADGGAAIGRPPEAVLELL